MAYPSESTEQAALAAHAPVRAATAADTAAGTAARLVAAPADAAAASALLGEAARLRLSVLPRGNGTKIDWGAPPRSCDLIIDTAALSGIDHAAGDLVVRAGAGTPFAELRRVLADAGQRLSVDEVVPGSTVGGVVATGVSGPRRMQHGPVRDLVIGMTVLGHDGVAASSGGRVVKNVAGYDLAKVQAGALGTLGLIASVTFRLHPVPPALRVVRAESDDPGAVGAWAAALRRSQVMPTAVELDWPGGGPLSLRVLLEGTGQGVAERADAVAAVLDGAKTEDAVPADWARPPGGPDDTLLEFAVPLAEVLPTAARLHDAGAAAGASVAVKGSAGCGVLYAAVPAGTAPDAVQRLLLLLRDGMAAGSATVRRAHPDLHAAGLEVWGEVPGLALMRAVKSGCDPDHRLSPGRFAGGL
ncbi:glycolate oxidase FAD binding subunit [Murinocardiopsis flavida]|uniref:Glycolate oxidase FAD binding subunit n=1 Tax=Murinocardiopsis flavida TaxID=645275 RepID=A0A2P8DUQ8_9ACTN|nr:FAD-binding protein [Murinocardiopsis flavida]PSL00973.1 glycolate oxidase FAD binding subunit [Murinocardiopsis flavida]